MANEVDFWADINLHGGSVRNMKIDSLSAAPTDGVEAGRVYYNTADKAYYYYNGSSWVAFAQGGSLDSYQLLSEKDAASGYAGLDSSKKIAIGEIPTGATANTVPLLVASVTDGYLLKYDASSGGFIGYSTSNIYTYKGSCVYANLPTDANAGDVYNVTDAHGNYPAGTNWAWTGSEWDALGGSIDLSGYQTSANMVTTLDGASDSTYPTTLAVSTALAEKQDTLTAGDGIDISDNAISLATTGITEGVYGGSTVIPRLTIDAYGRITAVEKYSVYPPTSAGTSGQYWTSDGSGQGVWTTPASSVDSSSTALVTSAAVASALSAITGDEESALGDKADKVDQTSGTYTKVTVNTQGVVESGTTLEASDIPGLDASKITSGTLDTARIVAAASGDEGKVLSYTSSGLALVDKVNYLTVTLTGNSTTTTFSATHDLGVMPCVTLYDSSGAVVYTDIVCTTTGVTVTFNTAPTDTFTLVLIG